MDNINDRSNPSELYIESLFKKLASNNLNKLENINEMLS